MPDCIRKILFESGFDTEISIENLNENVLCDVEKYANVHLHEVINNLKCCHSDIYKNDIRIGQFKFPPGHRIFILNLPKQIALKKIRSGTDVHVVQPSARPSVQHNFLDEIQNICARVKSEPALSNVLKELILTSITTSKKHRTCTDTQILSNFFQFTYICYVADSVMNF